MLNLKNYLLSVRWGDAMNCNDFALAKDMTLGQIFKSSYVLEKTIMTQKCRSIARR
jgi:hypothetical protein